MEENKENLNSEELKEDVSEEQIEKVLEDGSEDIFEDQISENSFDENEQNEEIHPEPTKEELLQNEVDSLKDKLMRTAAEFENFKKRTAKEKEELYILAVCDTVSNIIPVLDNLSRAILAIESNEDSQSLIDGVKMIEKQFVEVLGSMGVEEIKSVGEQFDPLKHNAVMHDENQDFGENTIIEEFMKGYMYKDKIIRHSMVKVVN